MSKWKKIWARKYAPFIAGSYLKAFQNHEFSTCPNKLYLPEGSLNSVYFDEKEFTKLILDFHNKLYNSNLEYYALFYENKFRVWRDWAWEVNQQDWSRMSADELISFIYTLEKELIEFASYQFLSFVVLEGAGREVEEKYSEQKGILGYISAPYKETIIIRARKRLLKLITESKIFNANFEQYLNEYAWLPMYEFVDKPLTKQQLVHDIEQIKNPDRELEHLEYLEYETREKYLNFIANINDEFWKKKIEVVHYFSYLKEMRDDYRRPFYYFFIPFWKEIERRTGLTVEESNQLLPEELIDVILHGVVKYREKIYKRKIFFSLVLNNGLLSIEETDLTSQFLGDISNSIHEVHGVCANKGTICGVAKIILHKGEFNKFENNDVIITAMTHPEFLSIMKCASAVVTDEGGITCHAAIIARELGKPCVIGTQIATKVFKDGDFIEVDAEKGVVRKIA